MNQATLTSVMVLSFSMCLHLEKQAVYWGYSELVPCKFSGEQQTVNTSQFACVAMVTRLRTLRGVRGQLSVEEEIKPINNSMNI